MHNVLQDLLVNFSESHKPFRDIFCPSKNSHCLIHPSCPPKTRSQWLSRLYKITYHFPPLLMCPRPLLQVLRLLTCESGHHSPAASDTWLHPFSFTSATGHCSLRCMLPQCHLLNFTSVVASLISDDHQGQGLHLLPEPYANGSDEGG